MTDYENKKELDVILLLDTLMSEKSVEYVQYQSYTEKLD